MGRSNSARTSYQSDVQPQSQGTDGMEVTDQIGNFVDSVFGKIEGVFSKDNDKDKDTFSWKASDSAPSSYGSSGAESHDHIPSTALDREKRLEQLKRLLDAGLIDKDEYKEKKREITGG